MKTFITVKELDAAISSFLIEDDYLTFRELTEKRLGMYHSTYEIFLQRRIEGAVDMGVDQIFLCGFEWTASNQGVDHWFDLHLKWKKFINEE